MSFLFVLFLAAITPEAKHFADEGAAALRARDLPRARAGFEAACKADPQNADLAYDLAQVREASGAAAEAAEAYERYLGLAPTAPDGDAVRARIVALRAAVPAPVKSSDDVPGAQEHLARGQALFKLNRLQEAEAAFAQAEHLAPGWGPPKFDLGLVCEAEEHVEDALLHYQAYEPLAPAKDRLALKSKLAELRIMADDARTAREAEQHKRAVALAAQRDQARRERDASGGSERSDPWALRQRALARGLDARRAEELVNSFEPRRIQLWFNAPDGGFHYAVGGKVISENEFVRRFHAATGTSDLDRYEHRRLHTQLKVGIGFGIGGVAMLGTSAYLISKYGFMKKDMKGQIGAPSFMGMFVGLIGAGCLGAGIANTVTGMSRMDESEDENELGVVQARAAVERHNYEAQQRLLLQSGAQASLFHLQGTF